MMKSRIPTILIGLCIPMAAIILAFPFYNRIEPFVLGFSFNYFWIFLWLFLTSLCLFIGYKLDPYNNPEVQKKADEKLAKIKNDLEKEQNGSLKAGKEGSEN